MNDGGGMILWELEFQCNMMLLAAFKDCLLGSDDMYSHKYFLTV
jgi:hypothetical protein